MLYGEAGLVEAYKVVKDLTARGVKVNRTCGFHVHVGIRQCATDKNAIARIATMASNFEKALYASTGTHTRENGRWCNGIRSRGGAHGVHNERYQIVNIRNVRANGRATVELRVFASTVKADKMVAHVRTAVGIVHRAVTIKRKTA